MSSKPSIPKGTRDFGPAEMARRNFILHAIRNVFQKYGFMPIETPAMENLDVLTGKYGDEGDKLLFRILNSGDYLSKTTSEDYQLGSNHMVSKISKKGLRYDLTVPFARYVVMNQHLITMPFKRYQIQPVWRADRPQKGRYQEFQQCDADVVGTDSLLCEAEVIWMIREVFEQLGVENYTIRINHRKILSGLAESIGAKGMENSLCVAIDKLDKIGSEKVIEELHQRSFSTASTDKLKPLLSDTSKGHEKNIELITDYVGSENVGLTDLLKVFRLTGALDHVEFDPRLARGLSYYTGCIFEVTIDGVSVGSVSGGGRYDDLTSVFGLSGISGIGFSFGVDRLYDAMEELELFPPSAENFTTVLLVAFDRESWQYSLSFLQELRQHGIPSELFPEPAKPKKQFTYADKKNIPFTLIAGEQEREQEMFSLKNMRSGEQHLLTRDQILEKLVQFQATQ